MSFQSHNQQIATLKIEVQICNLSFITQMLDQRLNADAVALFQLSFQLLYELHKSIDLYGTAGDDTEVIEV